MVVTYNIPIGFDFEEFVSYVVAEVLNTRTIIKDSDFPKILHSEEGIYEREALQKLLGVDEQAAYHIYTQIDPVMIDEVFNKNYHSKQLEDLRASKQIQEVFEAIKKSHNDKFTASQLWTITQTVEDLYHLLLNNIGPITANEFLVFATEKLNCTGIQEQKTHFREV